MTTYTDWNIKKLERKIDEDTERQARKEKLLGGATAAAFAGTMLSIFTGNPLLMALGGLLTVSALGGNFRSGAERRSMEDIKKSLPDTAKTAKAISDTLKKNEKSSRLKRKIALAAFGLSTIALAATLAIPFVAPALAVATTAAKFTGLGLLLAGAGIRTMRFQDIGMMDAGIKTAKYALQTNCKEMVNDLQNNGIQFWRLEIEVEGEKGEDIIIQPDTAPPPELPHIAKHFNAKVTLIEPEQAPAIRRDSKPEDNGPKI
ncbi:MAG: hypothetical protein OXT65_09685 [Alphaproteobacteria bacterium]|nr:hypothetical protein [Alphaproteobacteria bacterium]